MRRRIGKIEFHGFDFVQLQDGAVREAVRVYVDGIICAALQKNGNIAVKGSGAFNGRWRGNPPLHVKVRLAAILDKLKFPSGAALYARYEAEHKKEKEREELECMEHEAGRLGYTLTKKRRGKA
jgi:hypothetical protein